VNVISPGPIETRGFKDGAVDEKTAQVVATAPAYQNLSDASARWSGFGSDTTSPSWARPRPLAYLECRRVWHASARPALAVDRLDVA